mgnify:FL=1
MNATETGMVLEMITAHYWQTPKTAERNADLMVRTWQKTLADIPLQPHIELALDDWFKQEKWPPQAAELRERALKLGGPTPTMIAEAEAWNAREAFGTEYDDSWRERCAEGDCFPGDGFEYGEQRAIAVDAFWRQKRGELGLPPTDPLKLSGSLYKFKKANNIMVAEI